MAIYLDTMYVLWDGGSIKPVTLASLSNEEFNLLKEYIERYPTKVSIVDSPVTSEFLRSLIEVRKMQNRMKLLTKDSSLEMNMQVCDRNGDPFSSLLKRLSQ